MKRSTGDARRSLLLTLFVLAIVTAIAIAPTYFPSAASSTKGGSLFEVTTAQEEGLEDYDVRTSKKDVGVIMEYRASAGNALRAADLREKFVDAEVSLQRSIPTLKIEYSLVTRTPELIAPDPLKGAAVMTSASSEKRSAVLRNFAKANSDLVGVTDQQIDGLRVTSDYMNPSGNLGWASLEQFVNGIPVFRGEIKAGFTRTGEMFRVINNLASGLDYDSLRTDFGDPANAVRIAAADVKADVDMTLNAAESNDLKATFGSGYYPATASKYYFPIEPGLARAAWYVIVWKPVNGYEMMIDAETGRVLWRQNMGKDQLQTATYNVWPSANNAMLSQDSPAPLSPGPIDPSLGTQGPILPRTMVTLIGNEGPNAFNNNGWINDADNSTAGNNVIAGLDRGSPNGPDAAITGSGTRVFDFPTNVPPDTIPGGTNYPLPLGEAVSPCPATPSATVQDSQKAAVVQMFFYMNRLHDVLYRHGFTEQARNFQLDNFGRGGTGNDRVLAEGQDCSGTNNANFASSSTDGTTGRMQMYVFTGPTPDRDGTLDGDVIVHEVGHGVTNRLHTGGISGTQGGQMHEGNGDFLAHTLFSEPGDAVNGVYSMGGYATYFWRAPAPFSNLGNFYYGIRRFPKAVISSTGGPSNRPHNPLTYADIDPAQFNVTDGAFAPAFTGSATQAHDGGEVWSSFLWEVRARLITRLGHSAGTSKMVQLMLDGMKTATSTSSMLNSRNAILAGAQAGGTAEDVADVWAGFAARGMGFGALNPTGNTVVQSFDLPNVVQTPQFTFSDAAGDNDGFPEPGELLSLTIPLTNNTGSPATNVQLQVVGGGSANYGTINHGQTVTQNVSYTVPQATQCGSTLTLTFNVTDNIGPVSFTRSLVIGAPVVTATENFDGVTAPSIPAGWTADVVQSGINFVTTTNNPDTGANAAFALDPATIGGGTNLTSPSIAIASAQASVEFRNRYDTEAGWDGGVLELSIAGGAFQDVITAGGSFIQNGYTGTLGANGANNPLAGRNAWNGNSNGYLTSIVRLPAAAAGQNVQLRFRFGADDNTVGSGPNPGWYIDNIKVIGSYNCQTNTVRSRADFDGDGKTDLSVFRPSEGNWYLNRSTDGFIVKAWGLSTDITTPGDFDGDNKADTAIFRPSTGTWWILRSSDGGFSSMPFGVSGDVPVVGDYDGDNKADVAVFRPSTNVWYIQNSGGGTTIQTFGAAGDLPVRGDYNGDAKTDIAIFRPSTSTWWIMNSGGGVTTATFGLSTDKPVPADYDGDNKDDVAVYRPSVGTWFVLRSSDGVVSIVTFGIATDVPVPGDYDGDGRDDQAIYRNGVWWLNRSSAGVIASSFGLATDTPTPSRYIP